MPDNSLAPPNMPWLWQPNSPVGQPNGLGPPMLNYAAPPDATTSQGADVLAGKAQQAWQWLQDQRAESTRQGLLDPDTGMPTQKGVVEGARATAEGVAMGTTAPGEVPPPGIASPFDYRPDPGRALPSDNYLKSLNTHAPLMFREAHPSEAAEILPGRITVGGQTEKFLADNPDIALGQAQNKGGVQLAFDASQLKGQVNRSKPAWDFNYQNGVAEYVGRGENSEFRRALAGVRVPDSLNLSKGDGRALSFGLQKLQSQGWTQRATDNGYTEYLPPQQQPSQ